MSELLNVKVLVKQASDNLKLLEYTSPTLEVKVRLSGCEPSIYVTTPKYDVAYSIDQAIELRDYLNSLTLTANVDGE